MFCRNCANQMDNNAAVCVKCGVPRGSGTNFCYNCGAETSIGAVVCVKCGVSLVSQFPQKSKIAAGLLGLFLGGWGAHNFYLGFTKKAIIQIIVSVCTCGIGSIWGFIEGIMILAGSINVDSNGVPLKD